jgi:DNA polymerase III alpha subunit
MDLLPGNRAQKVAKIDQIIAIVNQEKEQKKSGQIGLFNLTSSFKNENKNDEISYENIPEMPLNELLEKEKMINLNLL